MSQKLALLIGNSEFSHITDVPYLRTTEADVRGLADALRNPEIGNFDEVTILFNKSNIETLNTIEAFFARKEEDDLLVMYFTGHAQINEHNKLHLLASDTKIDFINGTAIPAQFIVDAMNSSHSRRQVFILDTCYSGAFALGVKGIVDGSVDTANVFASNGYGRVVLASSTTRQLSLEGHSAIGQSPYSVFTHFLIQGLVTGAADQNDDGIITIDELFQYVYTQVVAAVPHQTPIKWSYDQQGEIIIARVPSDVEKITFSPTKSQLVSDLVTYINAKVVLAGDTGVGKSGLSLVLTGHPFVPTESTHARHVLPFDRQEVQLPDGRKEIHETLLWDLAGQPGYRLIHQLHLHHVVVALVVFDPRSETDPFAGVKHWKRALSQARRLRSGALPATKQFLVAARLDRGGISASQERIAGLLKELDFDTYFETSAKEGWQIAELVESIKSVIQWGTLPRVTSNALFERIKLFFSSEKIAGRQLSTIEDLYRAFLTSREAPDATDSLRAQFENCLEQMESQDLIRRLSYGDLVLLQPELLDAYASAIINAAKEEPDGLGSISEASVISGHFRMPNDERIQEQGKEPLLLIAVVGDLLMHEIALREGVFLVFPSQFTRENPLLLDPRGKKVVFRFEGPVLSIYTTLAVRLSYSGIFGKKAMGRNAASFTAAAGGTYGMILREVDEGMGELTLFFDNEADPVITYQFEDYIRNHLQERSLRDSVHRQRIVTCPNCDDTLTDEQTRRRRERGYTTIRCPVCDTEYSIQDSSENLETKYEFTLIEMERTADKQRTFAAAVATLQGKKLTEDYDVFLCHNSADKPAVRKIGEQLKEHGILPWLDEWNLRPGSQWQRVLEEQIIHIKSAAVFVGSDGMGPWQHEELDAFLREFVSRQCLVIPVILPNAPQEPALPVFLRGRMWVDFRQEEPDPLQRLIWGITGNPI